MNEVNVFVAFISGLFSFLSPCVLPLIPSYLSYVSGVSLEEMRSAEIVSNVRRRVILNSLAFIFGFSLVFVSLGGSATLLGEFFLSSRSLIKNVGGVLILLVGIYLMGIFKIPLFERYLQFNLKGKPAGYFGSALVGITFAISWTPCVGPILGAILVLAGTTSNVGKGMMFLAAYAGGLAIPFFLSAVAVNLFFQFSTVIRRYIQIIHILAGLLLIIVGILLLTDYISILNSFTLSLTPRWLIKQL